MAQSLPELEVAPGVQLSRRWEDGVQDVVQLLWTGGWDSTFRLCQLTLVEERAVQPIYLIDGRPSRQREMEAMRELREILEGRGVAALLRPTAIFDAKSHGPSAELRERYERLVRKHGTFGKQYLRMSYMGDVLDWHDVEVSWARGEVAEATVQALFEDPDAHPDDHRLTDSDEGYLFRRFRFPTLCFTKADMRQIATQRGFLEILQRTWFCQTPVRGQPCGRCRPCRFAPQTGESVNAVSGFEWRIRRAARKGKHTTRHVVALAVDRLGRLGD